MLILILLWAMVLVCLRFSIYFFKSYKDLKRAVN